MKENIAYRLGRTGGYGVAVALLGLTLGGCSATKPISEAHEPVVKLPAAHIEFHKKMLADQKKLYPKTAEK